MRKLMRKLSRVGDSKWSRVPEGHLPVYVGEEIEERFVIRADLLNKPVFLELLRRSAEEYGYEQRGVLRIPCSVEFFRRVLELLLDGAQSNSGSIDGFAARS